MNSSKINDWLQVVGLFGVIASLVFVGLQMRQDREIALSEAYQDRTAISLSLDYDFRNNRMVRNLCRGAVSFVQFSWLDNGNL
jgi:hypothetical protein